MRLHKNKKELSLSQIWWILLFGGIFTAFQNCSPTFKFTELAPSGPPGAEQLSAEQLAVPPCDSAPDVGFVAARRLNNVEYDNTLMDLLGLATGMSTSVGFPPDPFIHNFTNNADALNVTSDLAAKLFTAAQTAVAQAFSNSKLKQNLYTCDPNQGSCVSATLQSFLTGAFRRPPTADEITRYSAFVSNAVSQGDGADFGMQVAMTAALTSPHFLFRFVQLSQPASSLVSTTLNAFELASRLSYFLWSSMPDQTLIASAQSGALLTDAELTAQVKRMLADPRAATLVSQF
ncbi:MAG: hypothetical protein C5B49_03745, partial [Bdellovibrio sp.]